MGGMFGEEKPGELEEYWCQVANDEHAENEKLKKEILVLKSKIEYLEKQNALQRRMG